MLSTLLVCCAVLGAASEEGVASVDATSARPAYEQAQKDAGRDAAAHVRLALWCESHGMSAERMKHLALAVLYDPSNAMARGLLGLVAHNGKWGRPEDVGKRIQDDPAYRALIDEYLQRRAQAANKAEAQIKLAAWCEQKGLKAQAIAHYNVAVQLDPSRETAWRHLGYKKSGGRWVKPEEATAAKLEADRQRRADKNWRARLEKMRGGLEGKDAARKARAERARDDVTDPRSVPMIWAVFVAGGNERLQVAAVQMLGQIDGPAASAALATLAILLPEGTVRARAAETLMRRDPRDIAGRLIGLIRKPFTYTIKSSGEPGSVGELFVEGETFNVRRVYRMRPIGVDRVPAEAFAPSATPNPNNRDFRQVALSTARLSFGPGLGSIRDPNGDILAQALASDNVPGTPRRDRQLAAIRQDIQVLRQRLAEDILTVNAINAEINALNARVLPIVTAMTGQGPRRRAREVEGMVDRSARLCVPAGVDHEQADVQRVRRTRRAGRPALNASAPALWCTRSTAPARSSRSRSATACSRRTRLTARSGFSPCWPSTTPGWRRSSGSRSMARQSWPRASTGSGRPAGAGSWPASSSRAIASAPSAPWWR